jgi:hypothetical protein
MGSCVLPVGVRLCPVLAISCCSFGSVHCTAANLNPDLNHWVRKEFHAIQSVAFALSALKWKLNLFCVVAEQQVAISDRVQGI